MQLASYLHMSLGEYLHIKIALSQKHWHWKHLLCVPEQRRVPKVSPPGVSSMEQLGVSFMLL